MPIATSAVDNLEEHQRLFSKIGGFSLLATLHQPKSRSTVRLASSNPHDRPKIDFGILSNAADYKIARTAVRLSLKLGQDIKESGFLLGRNLTFPEEKQEKDIKNNNTEEIDKYIRQRIRTTYHYACSCRMMSEYDAVPGVVDDELWVHGVSGLGVCDTSVFPRCRRRLLWLRRDVRIGLRRVCDWLVWQSSLWEKY
jgi:choline dehydrogenase